MTIDSFLFDMNRTEFYAVRNIGIRTMTERSQHLQDLFLNAVRKQKISLTIFLVNGVKLTGIVTSFDNFCVLLRRDGHSQLVYKHAISTIMPSQPVQMLDDEEDIETDDE